MKSTKQQRAELTTKLRRLLREKADAKEALSRIRCDIFAATYAWVESLVAEEGVTQTAAHKRLGATLKLHEATVRTSYHAGKLMRQNGIDPRKASGSQVAILSKSARALTDAEFRKCVNVIRDGKPTSELYKVIRSSASAAAKGAKKRATRAMNAGKLTKTYCKMEIIAVKTILVQFFGKEVDIEVIDPDTDEVLLES